MGENQDTNASAFANCSSVSLGHLISFYRQFINLKLAAACFIYYRDRKDVCSAPSVGSAPSVDSSHSSDLVKDTTLFPTPHASANSVAVRISNYPPRGAGAVGGGTFPSGAKIYDNYSSTNPNNVTMYKSNDAPPMPMHGQWVLPIADGHSRTDAGAGIYRTIFNAINISCPPFPSTPLPLSFLFPFP